MDGMLSASFIEKVDLIGTLFKENSARVLGHDGAYSIPLENGRTFWSFGDTLLGPERRGFDPQKIDITQWCFNDPWARENISMISNSGLMSEAKTIQELMHGNFQYFVREEESEKEKIVEAREIIPVPEKMRDRTEGRMAFWPFDGIQIEGKLYVFYFMVRCIMTKMELQGVGLARSTYPYENFERLPALNSVTPKNLEEEKEKFIWWDNSGKDEKLSQIPGFGTAVLRKIINGYIYIYGSKLETMGNRVVPCVYLSRVSKNAVEDITEYEYLVEAPSKNNGFEPVWGEKPEESAVIFDGNANELSVSYNSYLKKYVAIYSYAGTLYKKGINDEIHMRVADKPEGPWSSPIIIYKPKRSMKKDFCYAAKEHPEYSRDGKTIYVTYVSHQRYFPELIEIKFR